MVAVLIAGTALWFGVPPLLGRLEFFRVQKLELRGLRNLDAEVVGRAIPLEPGRSIFDDLGAIQRAADTLAGVASARVSRRLPGTIVVEVEEVDPVVLVMHGGRLVPVGAQGEYLTFDPTTAAPDLPLIAEADSRVTGFLARARDADATFFSRIVTAGLSGPDVEAQVDGRRYLFRPDAGAEVIQAVTAVAQDLDRRGRPWAELDARFAGQVVVRRTAA